MPTSAPDFFLSNKKDPARARVFLISLLALSFEGHEVSIGIVVAEMHHAITTIDGTDGDNIEALGSTSAVHHRILIASDALKNHEGFRGLAVRGGFGSTCHCTKERILSGQVARPFVAVGCGIIASNIGFEVLLQLVLSLFCVGVIGKWKLLMVFEISGLQVVSDGCLGVLGHSANHLYFNPFRS
jgi:hypothetical protein